MASGDTKIIKISGQQTAADRGEANLEEPPRLPTFCDPFHLADSIAAAGEKIRKARNKPLVILATCLIDDEFVEHVWQRRKIISALSRAGGEPELEDLFDELRPLLGKIHQYVGIIP